MPDLKTPIRTIWDACRFIDDMHAAGLLYHFDDAPETIINADTGAPIFTPDQWDDVAARVAELFDQPWHVMGHDDPFGYALELINAPPVGAL